MWQCYMCYAAIHVVIYPTCLGVNFCNYYVCTHFFLHHYFNIYSVFSASPKLIVTHLVRYSYTCIHISFDININYTFIYIGNEIQLLVRQFSSPKTLYNQNMYDNCSISFFLISIWNSCLNLNEETWEHKIITVKDK